MYSFTTRNTPTPFKNNIRMGFRQPQNGYEKHTLNLLKLKFFIYKHKRRKSINKRNKRVVRRKGNIVKTRSTFGLGNIRYLKVTTRSNFQVKVGLFALASDLRKKSKNVLQISNYMLKNTPI